MVKLIGNYGYAFYADANSALRANDIWLYAENNGLGASFVAAHTVTIERALNCRFWAYVEEQVTGLEMKLGANTSGCFVYSTRRNTDIDLGSANLWQFGQSFYRPDATRMSTILNLYCEYSRVGVAGEYVQMPLLGSGGAFGYLRGTGGSAGTQKLQLMSEDLGSYIGIQDDLAFTNETFKSDGALVSGEKTPTLASATQSSFGNTQTLTAAGSTVTLFTLPSTDSTTAGRVYVSCESSGGVKFSYIFDIYISNSVFTVINAATGNSQSTTTAALQKTGANIELVMTYSGGAGANVRVFASGVVNAVNY